jgi:hypothetical protein
MWCPIGSTNDALGEGCVDQIDVDEDGMDRINVDEEELRITDVEDQLPDDSSIDDELKDGAATGSVSMMMASLSGGSLG